MFETHTAGQGTFPPITGYDVRRFAGRGGMGIVYEAIHHATGRTVALKLVNPSGAQDPVTRERFGREVHALAALKHPNIIPVYDAGEWHGFPYCAMEFVAGGTLGQHLDRVREDLRGAVRIVAKVARAVAAMHASGVLHRDLKPLNVLLGPDDEPMVADFGLARWSEEASDLTYTGLPIGTRQYMAPEQTLGRRADYTAACDIWAIGITLYEVLTGHRPFEDDDHGTGLFARIRTDPPPPVSVFAPTVPPELEAVARRCLEKHPGDRYDSAAAVADDLERWLVGVPVVAVLPISTKKPRRALAYAAVAVASILVGVFGVIRQGRLQAEPVKRTLAARVAAGEKVQLTNEKGNPSVSWSSVPGHELAEKGIGDYRGFSSHGIGLATLADEQWEGPILLEADVAVGFSTENGATGGLYFGRRTHEGVGLRHETLALCGVSPKLSANKQRVLRCSLGLFWWEANRSGSLSMRDQKDQPWSPDGTPIDPRFAHVVVKVREKNVEAIADGVLLEPLTEAWMLDDLNLKRRHRPELLGYTFSPPAFGTGIGVFCWNAECTVRNLTVSKLDP